LAECLVGAARTFTSPYSIGIASYVLSWRFNGDLHLPSPNSKMVGRSRRRAWISRSRCSADLIFDHQIADPLVLQVLVGRPLDETVGVAYSLGAIAAGRLLGFCRLARLVGIAPRR